VTYRQVCHVSEKPVISDLQLTHSLCPRRPAAAQPITRSLCPRPGITCTHTHLIFSLFCSSFSSLLFSIFLLFLFFVGLFLNEALNSSATRSTTSTLVSPLSVGVTQPRFPPHYIFLIFLSLFCDLRPCFSYFLYDLFFSPARHQQFLPDLPHS
jgi:hypothetical protein